MRFHRGNDGWSRDSYQIPQFAIAGSSDCGMWSDSPAPSDRVAEELEGLRKVLRANHIRSRIQFTRSGNVFMVKRWVVVHSRDFARAKVLADQYLADHDSHTHYIHDAA